ncbi:CHASE3 domain-containing protein [Xylophilus sp. GOD-11R]|uniref:CHASE3 domain-containing protein n=1 Tax=Xylophilus sp. GOD-11R TaxID=3089814 RepID=UPI00298D153A|nr:CHASE3 domain-containing protein [Xylophilus sp. GOD-11R]WPB56580.1 CHASE3 domain-containing protein [Xylophilus sp. GOD-11R]
MISLPAAVLAAVVLVGINETGYRRSTEALEEIERAQQTRVELSRLLQQMLDAETGQRGFLLTGDERYLQPYSGATAGLNQTIDRLRNSYLKTPEEIGKLAELSRNISRKLAEMDLSVRLRKQGNDEAWRFILLTDVGREHMDSIRAQVTQLVESRSQAVDAGQRQVVQALQLARLGIAAVALIGLLAFYMYLRQTRALEIAGRQQQEELKRERDRLGDQVRERTASLAELATHLQQVREDERAYLARELHDELGSLLTAAKLDVARIKSKIGPDNVELQARLQHLTETLNSGIALKRNIIEDLRPSSLSNLGLVAALEILARETGDRNNLSIHCRLEKPPLDDSAQLTVYRMVQEALTNISKYAHAHEVQVRVGVHPTYVLVEIQDDGAGFEKERIDPSTHGLQGMRHRVETAGGRLTITTAPGAGTRVTATLPHSA